MAVAASSAMAAGFALYETSPRGVAMGGATMGVYCDPSATYANPALLTEHEGNSLMFGVSMIKPEMEFDLVTPAGTEAYEPKGKWFPPPFAYVNSQISDSLWFGLGVYMPYGLGVEFDRTWSGRYNSVETEFTALNVNPNIAWKLNDKLSLAVGIDVMYLDVTITRCIRQVEMLLENTADCIDFGVNAALSYKLTDDLGVGLVYRSPITEELSGDAKLGPLHNGGVSEDLTLPQSVSLGVNYTGFDKWNIGAIATWTGWSSYDNLTLHFDPALLGTVKEAGADKDWDDVWRFGVGIERQISDELFMQVGYAYDMDPINNSHGDYMMPAGDRHIVSIGMTTPVAENCDFSISYARIMLTGEHVLARPAEGVYETNFKKGGSAVVCASFSLDF